MQAMATVAEVGKKRPSKGTQCMEDHSIPLIFLCQGPQMPGT